LKKQLCHRGWPDCSTGSASSMGGAWRSHPETERRAGGV
jgi:hypothetical protein